MEKRCGVGEQQENRERKIGQTLNCAVGMFCLCLSAPISLGLVGSQSSETFSMCANISTGALAHITRAVATV